MKKQCNQHAIVTSEEQEKDIKELEKRNAKEKLKQLAGE